MITRKPENIRLTQAGRVQYSGGARYKIPKGVLFDGLNIHENGLIVPMPANGDIREEDMYNFMFFLDTDLFGVEIHANLVESDGRRLFIITLCGDNKSKKVRLRYDTLPKNCIMLKDIHTHGHGRDSQSRETPSGEDKNNRDSVRDWYGVRQKERVIFIIIPEYDTHIEY